MRQRVLNSLPKSDFTNGYRLEGSALARYRQTETRIAVAALGARALDADRVVTFIQWLCRRWDEWTHRDRMAIAKEYKSYVQLSAECFMCAHDMGFEELAHSVGRVTGHHEKTLDIMFPDRTALARERTAISLAHSVIPRAPSAESALTVGSSDVNDFLVWLDKTADLKLHLHIEALLDRQFKLSAIDIAALAKEVEGIAGTFEHLLNVILRDAGEDPSGKMLKRKLLALWAGVGDVHAALKDNWGLTQTAPPSTVPAQLRSIASLNLTTPNADVARLLLRSVLHRNDGAHNGLGQMQHDELLTVALDYIACILVCRKATAFLVPVAPPTGP